MKKIYFVLLSALLGGCSVTETLKDSVRAVETQFTNATELTEQLRTSQINTVPLYNLSYRLLSLETTNRVDITDKSSVVNLPEGNSFVAAFLLPERMSRFTFTLESIIGRTVFVPSVLFLDSDFNEIARIDDITFTDKSLLIEKSYDDGTLSEANYVVVYTKDSELDGQTPLRDIVREYEEANNGKSVSEISHPKPFTKHAPIGNINVTLTDVYFEAKTVKKERVKPVEKVEVIKTVQESSILSDTENFYLQMITDAVNNGNLTRAKSLTEEAVRAGSSKALPHYIEEIGKMK